MSAWVYVLATAAVSAAVGVGAWRLASGLCVTGVGKERLQTGGSLTVTVAVAVLLGQVLIRLAADPVHLIGYAIFAAVLVAAALVDYAEMRLPDVLTVPLIGAAVLVLPWLVDGDGWDHARPVLGVVAAGGWALLVAVLADQSLGDVKLAAGIGGWLAWHSWTALAAGVLVGQILVAVVVGLRGLRRRRAGQPITDTPLGPALAVGAMFGLVLATTY